MANTREHAQSRNFNVKRNRKNWWAAAAFDDQKGEAYFACVDLGVGIFNSLQVRSFRRRFFRGAGILSNADLLQSILRGRIESTTGVPFRGKGLPAIYEAARSGRIRELVLLSNDAYANVDRDDYREISPPFEGTILAWEVGKDQMQ
jgi:hypothetical protein